MKRFHKKVYFPNNAEQKLQELTAYLNKQKSWFYSQHCLDNLKYRVNNAKEILLYIKDLQLNYKDIFEYYEDNTGIKKAVYKIDYKKIFDLCLVVSEYKKIVTIYVNSKGDNHATLKKELYVSN